MKTVDLLHEQHVSLWKHVPPPFVYRFAVFLGEERLVDLARDKADGFEPVTLRTIALSPSDPPWADGGNGHGFGAIGRWRGFFVFRHLKDPHACHFELMEPLVR